MIELFVIGVAVVIFAANLGVALGRRRTKAEREEDAKPWEPPPGYTGYPLRKMRG